MKTRSLSNEGAGFFHDRRLAGKHLFRIPNSKLYQRLVRQKSTSCWVKSATLSARRDA